MTSPSGAIVVVAAPRTRIFAALGKELRDAGFEIVTAEGIAKAIALLDRPTLRAAVVPEGASLIGSSFRRLRDAAHRRGLPVVLVTARNPSERLALPVGTFGGADGEITEADIRTSGGAARAVRAAIDRGPVEAPRTPRERLGKILWYAGAASFLVVLAALGWECVAVTWRSFEPPHSSRAARWLLMALWGLLAAYRVLTDVGWRLATGRHVGLRWTSWLFLAIFAAVLVCP